MPKVYRSMWRSADGLPIVEPSARGLGVRAGSSEGHPDVDLADGLVVRNGKGMSVAPSWRALPFHRISRRLKNLVPKAAGHDDLYCFVAGSGPFESGPFAAGLELVQDGPRHGVIAPIKALPLNEYQTKLAETRGLWTVDEA